MIVATLGKESVFSKTLSGSESVFWRCKPLKKFFTRTVFKNSFLPGSSYEHFREPKLFLPRGRKKIWGPKLLFTPETLSVPDFFCLERRLKSDTSKNGMKVQMWIVKVHTWIAKDSILLLWFHHCACLYNNLATFGCATCGSRNCLWALPLLYVPWLIDCAKTFLRSIRRSIY